MIHDIEKRERIEAQYDAIPADIEVDRDDKKPVRPQPVRIGGWAMRTDIYPPR